MAVYRGYVKANTPPKTKPPTDERFREVMAQLVH